MTQEVPGPKNGDTYRTKCGRGRVTYDDVFYRGKPWGVYLSGTAVIAFATLDEARQWFHKKGLKLVC